MLLRNSGIVIIWELEKEWLEEGSTVLAELLELSVVVWNQSILVSHSISNDVKVSDCTMIDLVSKEVWLLALTIPTVVVS